MEHIVGIFRASADADRAVHQLRASGIEHERIVLFHPGATPRDVASAVPQVDAESEGMGEALGGVVGGALGAASGATLGIVATSLFVPGIGPVIVGGVLGAAVFGAGGALAGVAAGQSLEQGLAKGLPHDELFVYEDALRHGRSVVMVFPDQAVKAEQARSIFTATGAESVDAAHRDWWLGLRSAEKENYERAGGDFVVDETNYRRGFEAALHPSRRGQSFVEARDGLRDRYQENELDHAFRAGYGRGLWHQRQLEEGVEHRQHRVAGASNKTRGDS